MSSNKDRYLVLGVSEDDAKHAKELLITGGAAPNQVVAMSGLPVSDVRAAIVLNDAQLKTQLQRTVKDATESLEVHEQIAMVLQSLRLLELAIDQGRDGLVITDTTLDSDGPRIIYANQAFRDLMSDETSDPVNQPLLRVAGINLPRKRVVRGLHETGSWEGEVRTGRRGDASRLTEVHIRAVTDGSVEQSHHVAVFRDITQKRRVQEHLTRLAHHDHLTGLPNRKLFNDRLDQAILRGKRYDEQLAVLFIDLDGFKLINDTLGHNTGDLVLRAVSDRLAGLIRASDTVARLGGDEFTVLLPGLHEPANAEAVADKVLDSVSKVIRAQHQEVFVTPSIGIACYPRDGENARQLIEHADQAMYQAKAGGKASWIMWNPQMAAQERTRADLVRDLSTALERRELHLHAQTIWECEDLNNGEPAVIELLLRWTHPTRGRVSPATFLPLLSESGIEDAVFPWMLQRGCTHMARNEDGELGLALDMHACWLSREDLVDVVLRTLHNTSLAADRLALEINEELLVRLDTDAVARLRTLQNAGVRIIVDQYGTSHLSLPQLRSLPLDGVKFDTQVIRRTQKDDTLVRSICILCDSLELTVIVQGVHSQRQRDQLHALGCHMQQGHAWQEADTLDRIMYGPQLVGAASG